MPVKTRLTLEIARRLLPNSLLTINLKNLGKDNVTSPVFLTFDDGPHPEYTPILLDVLSELDAKATFFVLGKQAKSYPGIVRRILSEGHSVGTHTWNHLSANCVPVSDWISDVQHARVVVEDILGVSCSLFRPPYGELTPSALLTLIRSGLQTIYWTLDTKDYECENRSLYYQWFANNRPTRGAIVLLHDNVDMTRDNLYESCLLWKKELAFLPIPMK